MWFVYILRCADNSLYVGETHDVPGRVARHNEGTAAAHTAQRRPVHLVYTEEHAKRADCLKRERQLKRWTRAKKEALITGDRALLKKL
jgi:predicted GIY-YIG superfamily endonuclease